MGTPTRLRERQKQQTRDLIFDAASRLFAERGFDAVTVSEVAQTAGVSEMTVFNHFPSKEDLFFHKMEFFEEQLLEAVRGRPGGVSALDAFRGLVVEGCSVLAQRERSDAIARAATLIGASPSLQIREREIAARYTGRLAELLAAETGADPEDIEVWGVASGLIGTHRALVRYVRERVVAGHVGRKLVAEARSQAGRAFARLERGLADYAVAPRSSLNRGSA